MVHSSAVTALVMDHVPGNAAKDPRRVRAKYKSTWVGPLFGVYGSSPCVGRALTRVYMGRALRARAGLRLPLFGDPYILNTLAAARDSHRGVAVASKQQHTYIQEAAVVLVLHRSSLLHAGGSCRRSAPDRHLHMLLCVQLIWSHAAAKDPICELKTPSVSAGPRLHSLLASLLGPGPDSFFGPGPGRNPLP